MVLDADVNFRGVGEGAVSTGVRIYEQHVPPARILELVTAAGTGR